ncbi:MAG: RNA polymerase sigma-70 factor [Bacteroidales bacterium]|nr:MAG: RNA polymerase sigma-70 factor [Bacteroidales bacterium]
MTQYSDDKLIINKLKGGDVLSFDEIFEKYNKKVYYFALSYLKNKEEAEDVVQEVFMNLWKCQDQIDEYYVFSKYLFKIAYNATCKTFRKRASDRKQLEEVLQYISINDNSTKLDIEYNNLLETANLLIEKLPSRQKKILRLSIEEHLSTDQIAQKLNISKKTVENYLALAKSSIRKSFANGGILSVLFAYLFF